MSAPVPACAPASAPARTHKRKGTPLPLRPRSKRVRARAVRQLPEYLLRDGNGNFCLSSSVFVSSTSVCDALFPMQVCTGEGMRVCKSTQYNYQWRKVSIDCTYLRFLQDEEGFFRTSDTYLVRMEHGNFFAGNCLFTDNASGFQAVICIFSSGASAVGVRHSPVVEHSMRRGDYIVMRSSQVLQFLPQVAGCALYLIVRIEPTDAFFATYVRDLAEVPEVQDAAFEAAARKWRRATELVDDILRARLELEKMNFRRTLLRELQTMYEDIYASCSGKPDLQACDDMVALESCIQDLVSMARMALDVAASSRREESVLEIMQRLETAQTRAMAAVQAVRRAHSQDSGAASAASAAKSRAAIVEMIRRDVSLLERSILQTTSSLQHLAREVSMLVPGVMVWIDMFVVGAVSRCHTARYCGKLMENMLALRSIGIPRK